MALVAKSLPANAGGFRDAGSILVRKILWERARQLIPIFLPGEFHGQRILVGYIKSHRVGHD